MVPSKGGRALTRVGGRHLAAVGPFDRAPVGDAASESNERLLMYVIAALLSLLRGESGAVPVLDRCIHLLGVVRNRLVMGGRAS